MFYRTIVEIFVNRPRSVQAGIASYESDLTLFLPDMSPAVGWLKCQVLVYLPACQICHNINVITYEEKLEKKEERKQKMN